MDRREANAMGRGRKAEENAAHCTGVRPALNELQVNEAPHAIDLGTRRPYVCDVAPESTPPVSDVISEAREASEGSAKDV
jgi:hypothetical protein